MRHGILDFMKKIKTIMCEKQNKYFDLGIGIVLTILSLIALWVCVIHGLGEDIWFDEVFSVRFMQHGYSEIAWLTSQDVHPPVYYWYLKLFHDIVKVMVPAASSVVLCKLASVLPFLGIYVYAFTLVRKRFGIKVMGFFLFLVTTMPQIPNYTVEIRMYALALFFITAVFLHGHEIVLKCVKDKADDTGNVGQTGHWIAFWIYGILTAYTQYYACIAVIAVYISLFIFFLVQKQKKQMIKVMVYALLSVAAYLPWLPSFISQVTTVSSNYWIQPLTFRSIFGCMKHVFLPVSYATTKNYILAVAMIVVFAVAFLYSYFKKKDVTHRYVLLCGLFIPVFTAFMGFVCSALNRPIFVYRYLIPCLGAMWLVAAYVIWDCFSKNWGILLLLVFLFAGHSNMQGFYNEEHKKIVEMESTQSFWEAFPSDAVVLCNFNHVQALSAYYLGEETPVYLYGGEPESLIAKLMPNCRSFTDTDKIKDLVEKESVYFFGSFNSRDDLLAEWALDGITYTEEGTYLLERYYFNVYHLSVEE